MGGRYPDAIEWQLAHQETDDICRAYMHAAEFWPERVRMMRAWADYLDDLRSLKLPRVSSSRLGSKDENKY